jgi:hypothetical protein
MTKGDTIRVGPSRVAAGRSDQPPRRYDMRTTQVQACRYCGYNPASDRIFGYCSWDCHDADDGDDDEEGQPEAA